MVGLLVEPQLLDIGYGMPIQISSIFGGGDPPPHLVPSADPAAPFFRTDVERSPSITIDLRCVRHVNRIRVFNNESEPMRGVPLAVLSSIDGEEWTEILVMRADFGGRVTASPLVISFKYYTAFRYLRLQCLTEGSLRLQYVEICAPLPQEYLGKLYNIRVTETDVLADYTHHDSYGFSWTFTCTLSMIFNARLLGICIDQINYRLCLHGFKDNADQDAYDWLFEAQPRSRADQPEQWPVFERHGVYASFPLQALTVYADLYFRPHRRVRTYADQLVATYGLNLSNTIVLLYRGTDKAIEIEPATPASYAAVARSIMARDPGLTVLCQTDQTQARDAIVTELPETVWFAELPVTEGIRPIHQLDVATEFSISKSELALRLLAMTYLVSKAKYVVTHTGNLGAWVALYRGRPEGLYQFCADGKLRGPNGQTLTPELEPLEG
jgi:hypothetical protein